MQEGFDATPTQAVSSTQSDPSQVLKSVVIGKDTSQCIGHAVCFVEFEIQETSAVFEEHVASFLRDELPLTRTHREVPQIRERLLSAVLKPVYRIGVTAE